MGGFVQATNIGLDDRDKDESLLKADDTENVKNDPLPGPRIAEDEPIEIIEVMPFSVWVCCSYERHINMHFIDKMHNTVSVQLLQTIVHHESPLEVNHLTHTVIESLVEEIDVVESGGMDHVQVMTMCQLAVHCLIYLYRGCTLT